MISKQLGSKVFIYKRDAEAWEKGQANGKFRARLYRSEPFTDDDERAVHLLELHKGRVGTP